MIKFIKSLFIRKQDLGLRGTYEGKLYIDKDVFFKRKDVLDMLDKIKKSEAYPK